LPVPKKFLGGRYGSKESTPAGQTIPERAVGRQPKCGMEGLAVTADARRVYAIVQSPLFQDGAVDENNQAAGFNNRILEIDVATGKTREFVYQLDAKKNGVNEMVAVGDDQFLVLERDSEGSSTTAFARIFKVDIAGATDVSGVERLAVRNLPAGVRPVEKRLFIDLRDRRFNLTDPACPAKAEGLAFGPDLNDGRHLLLVSCDNDFNAQADTKIMAFAVASHALPAYRPQKSILRIDVAAPTGAFAP
jgi:hypothetical protein